MATSVAVPSDSKPNKSYTVSVRPNGEYTCTCPAFQFRKRYCKHILRNKHRLNASVQSGPAKLKSTSYARNTNQTSTTVYNVSGRVYKNKVDALARVNYLLDNGASTIEVTRLTLVD